MELACHPLEEWMASSKLDMWRHTHRALLQVVLARRLSPEAYVAGAREVREVGCLCPSTSASRNVLFDFSSPSASLSLSLFSLMLRLAVVRIGRMRLKGSARPGQGTDFNVSACNIFALWRQFSISHAVAFFFLLLSTPLTRPLRILRGQPAPRHCRRTSNPATMNC